MSAGREQVRVGAAEIVAERVFAAASSRVTAEVVAALTERSAVSGIVHVGQHAVTRCREVSLATVGLLHAVDLAAYERHQATPSAPMGVPGDDQSLIPWSLDDFAAEAIAWGADVVLTPSGFVGVGQCDALAAVIEAGNSVEHQRVVTTAALPQEWLTTAHRSSLLRQLQRSTKPLALVVIGQLDPYEDLEVTQGLLEVLSACPGKIFHHRTDLSAVETLARGGLAASIGVTTSLRHTVPPGRRPQKRRRPTRLRRPMHIFVPGICEFRDLAELEVWFGDEAPHCALTSCCGRLLTDFRRDATDAEVLAAHNVRGWLPLAEDLIACPPSSRRSWLRQHHLRVETAYAELRMQTGVRAIRPYGSARIWSSLGV